MFKNLSIKSKVIIGCVTPLFLILAVGGIGFFGFITLEKVNEEVIKTEATIIHASELEISILGMDTAVKKYMLTGDTAFLRDYNSNYSKTMKGLNTLEKEIGHLPESMEHVIAVRDIISD